MATPDSPGGQPEFFDVRIERQDAPDQPSYWELFRIPYEPELNVISVLQRIAAHPVTADGKTVAPVVWECSCLEEVCGSCTMVINGRVRQSCSALIDELLAERPGLIELQPMSKFPVVRDLVVDRRRLFRALEKTHIWVRIDGYFNRGRGPLQTRETQEDLYPYSKCMSCGCCLEACPQYAQVVVSCQANETEEECAQRENAVFDQHFLGAHAISLAMLMNAHPTGANISKERLDALIEPGGIQNCGNAQNCVRVCPKEIPLTTSIARAGRATTVHAIKSWLER
jgi:succinate dehydrogenase / fumarate reductase iron-sulfur subunit